MSLPGKSLNGTSFGSVKQLIARIDCFIANYNEDARPFIWTKCVVNQKRVKPGSAVP